MMDNEQVSNRVASPSPFFTRGRGHVAVGDVANKLDEQHNAQRRQTVRSAGNEQIHYSEAAFLIQKLGYGVSRDSE
jgi:hypothetical protein